MIVGVFVVLLVLAIAALVRWCFRLQRECKIAWAMAEHATVQHMRTAMWLELARDQLRGAQHSRFVDTSTRGVSQ